MKTKYRRNSNTGAQLGCAVIVIILAAIVNAVAFPYAINAWLVFFGKEASIVWWQGVLIGLVPGIGQLSITLAVITWIIMLFL